VGGRRPLRPQRPHRVGEDADRPVRVLRRVLVHQVEREAVGVDAETGPELERIWRDGQRRMLALSTDSSLVVAECSGHLIPAEQPEIVVSEVRALFADIGQLP
jgi:hypothetical protein